MGRIPAIGVDFLPGEAGVVGVWSTRRRTVIKAVHLCGDEVQLAKYLGIPVQRAVDPILGEEMCTPDEFLALVDLVLDDERKTIELNKDRIERIREKYR